MRLQNYCTGQIVTMRDGFGRRLGWGGGGLSFFGGRGGDGGGYQS